MIQERPPTFNLDKALTFIQETFLLSQDEKIQISTCVRTYANSNTQIKVKNAIFSIFNQSDWAVAKQTLITHSGIAFSRLNVFLENNLLQIKAEAMSEFLLRYLVTAISDEDQKLIDPEYKTIVDRMTLDQIIVRAKDGDGRTFPKRPRSLSHL